MCGIAGVVYRERDKTGDEEAVRKMAQALHHRGPDAEGYHLAPGVGLGVRRLSIIDLKTGDQPVYNEDHSVAVVCNGEIYNYVELSRELMAKGHNLATCSDTEVIAHLYEEHSAECVHRLRGMFAFALWDARRNRLLLARDRFGIKPLYYMETPWGLCFASEQKALLASGSVSRDLNTQSLRDLFSFGFVCSPETMFSSVHQVPPASYLISQGGRASLVRYWSHPIASEQGDEATFDEGEWAEILRRKLEETLILHMRSDVPVGAWLSGGLDSSAIVALTLRLTERPLHTSSLCFDQARQDEIRGKRTLLDYPGYDIVSRLTTCTRDDLRVLPEALWYSEDPTTSGLEVPRLLLAASSSEDVKVVLTGEGADEVFGGYPWFRTEKLLHLAGRLPLPLRRSLAKGPVLTSRFRTVRHLLAHPMQLGLARYRCLLNGPREMAPPGLFSKEVLASMREEHPVDAGAVPPEISKLRDPFSWLQHFEFHVRLPSLVIPTLDRGSMARSVEARVPFLDHELVELAPRIPTRLKLRGFREKHILRQAVRDTLPGEIAKRRKRGMRAPVHDWLRSELPEFAADMLSAKSLARAGYFEPRQVAQMLAEHRGGQRDWGYPLMGVLGVQLWDHMFLRGHGPLTSRTAAR